MRIDGYDPKNTPIKFTRIETGVYVSTCERYRIKLTTHTGRLHGRGARRWWITDLIKCCPIKGTLGMQDSVGYELSLGDAIERLHMHIARGIAAGFKVFTDLATRLASESAADAERSRRASALGAEMAPLLEGFGCSAQAAYGVARELVAKGWRR